MEMPEAQATATVQALTEKIRKVLPDIYPDNAAFERAVREAYGTRLTVEKSAPAMRFLRRVAHHPRLPEFLAKFLHSHYAPSQSDSKAIPIDASLVQLGSTFAKLQGFKRLEPARQAEVLSTMIDMLKAVGPIDCRRIMLGDISAQEVLRLESDYVIGLSAERFERLIRLHEDAVLAELSQTPPARVITDEQTKSGQQALEAGVAALRRSRFSAMEIWRFDADPSFVPSKVACGIGVADLEAMLRLTEPQRTWSIGSFIDSM